MKVTGFKLREAIKEHELRRDIAKQEFTAALSIRLAELGKVKDPLQLAQEVDAAELAIARLQSAQAHFNNAVKMSIDNRLTSLTEAIKLLGGWERRHRMWRDALEMRSRHAGQVYGVVAPDNNNTVVWQMTTDVAKQQVGISLKASGRLRSAISQMNAIEVELEDLDESLFQ